MNTSKTNETTDSDPASDSADKIGRVQTALLAWFEENRRDLPWRRTRDPYRILVSEVMLQQTQVERVLPYYESFLNRFPDVEALATAPTADVITMWAGLGYNRRAVNLQRTAIAVVESFAGEFPKDIATLRQLPGIGPYTAGAIACFAFEQDVAFVDTNIRRVLHRVFHGVDVPRPTTTERDMSSTAQSAIPIGQGWIWNQAIMEFGALQCTARKPACIICPLQQNCAAFPAIQTAIAELPPGVRLKREAPFADSNRFYRGRVLAALRDHPDQGITLAELGPRVRIGFTETELNWLDGVVSGLAKDGLARVAEDSPEYDARSSELALGDRRVTLP